MRLITELIEAGVSAAQCSETQAARAGLRPTWLIHNLFEPAAMPARTTRVEKRITNRCSPFRVQDLNTEVRCQDKLPALCQELPSDRLRVPFRSRFHIRSLWHASPSGKVLSQDRTVLNRYFIVRAWRSRSNLLRR
jgi:hypothetical protein